ncbi:MAG: hypothetical protein EPO40_02965 [Myxococcaceae bacterium]|nr:MAG: hypothetical protein EPO40_02965 [Myxococcaceae bacterium]
MTPDELETRAQQIHADRHRAGTASVCGSCRDEAAGVPRRTLLDRVIYPARPNVVGFTLGGLVVAVAATTVITGERALWVAGWFVLAAMAWCLLGPPQDRSHIPSK